MTVVDTPPVDAPDVAAQALLAETRRRRRRRRVLVLGVSLFVVAGGVIVTTETTTHRAPPPHPVVEWVAGSGTPSGSSACQFGECNSVGESSFTEPDQLAFDGAGDLYVSGAGGFQLFEITARGSLLYLQQFRGDGAPGALATDPDGSIIEAWRDGVDARTPAGATSDVPGSIDSTLNATLGLDREPQGTIPNVFIAGDGVAVGSNGDVYLDINVGNTFTTESELVRLSPTGQATVLWNSSSPSS
jgi:hypothetical protein